MMRYIIDKYLRNLHYNKMSFCLLAPTGRAAKVLSKYTENNASTIHKKIYYSKVDKSGNFKSTLKKNKIKNIVFIVDEASMISDFSNSNDLFKKNSFLKSAFDKKLFAIGIFPKDIKNLSFLESNIFYFF